MERWASFDCYGTLIDWNGGIGRVLEELFGAAAAPHLLHRYHALEPLVEREQPGASYRAVLDATLARVAAVAGLPLPAEQAGALSSSLPDWPAFPEVRAALEDVRSRGWKLAILSNTDRDYLDASVTHIGVPFDRTIVASEIGSYKPAHHHWEVFFAETGAARAGHVHVAASLFHDIRPATDQGLRTIWINRLGEAPEPQPDVELHTLEGLGDALDSLVP